MHTEITAIYVSLCLLLIYTKKSCNAVRHRSKRYTNKLCCLQKFWERVLTELTQWLLKIHVNKRVNKCYVFVADAVVNSFWRHSVHSRENGQRYVSWTGTSRRCWIQTDTRTLIRKTGWVSERQVSVWSMRLQRRRRLQTIKWQLGRR